MKMSDTFKIKVFTAEENNNASNHDRASVEEVFREEDERNNDTLFTTAMRAFPVVEGGRINTQEFLEASKGITLLVEKFGTVFTPIKYDLNQNISKIEAKFLEDTKGFKYLDDLVMEESKSDTIIVTDALQWLRRGLHFMWHYFHLIVNDEEKDGSDIMNIAYKQTLQPYHGWMGQQLFNIIVKFAPTRSDLYDVLALHRENQRDVVKIHMEQFLVNLKICIDHLVQFYLTNGFERTQRV